MAAAKKRSIAKSESQIDAMVPDIEKPYQVPDNWFWGYLTASFAECKDGFRKPVNATERSSRIGDVPYYGATGQVGWIDDYLTDEELVLLGEDGAPFLDLMKDKAYLISGKAWVNNHAHILKSYFGHVGNLYLLYYLNAFNYTGFVNGTTRLKLTQASMDTIPIPIAPLAEQQRIVERIESLFAKLDEAKEKAQAVVDGFEDRKAAILHKAFSGDLVKQHNDLSHKWVKVFLRDVVSGFKYGTSEKSDYSFTGMPVLRIPNIGEDGIDFSDIKYLTTEHIDAESQIHENDILIIRSNGSRDLVGKCALVPFLDQEYAYASFLIRIKPSEKIRADYLALYLNSREARNQMSIKAKSSAGIHNINSKELGSIIVRLPSLNEQKEIVIAIQKLMQPEKQANELTLETIDQINSMKKAILARAFRGELGTNDPNDESAIKLLKRIL